MEVTLMWMLGNFVVRLGDESKWRRIVVNSER
jgi:hypothetical protein